MSLSCVQRQATGQVSAVVLSGFIANVENEWLYITAGHILRQLKQAIDAGTTFNVWRLSDATARGRFQDVGIPFDFELDQWAVIVDEDLGLDYAAVVLRPIYRAALEAGGAQPLPIRAWGSDQSEHQYWALIGVPSETVSYDADAIITAKMMILVLAPAESPDGPSDKDRYRFYATLVGDSADAVESVDGMSGGPVFALRAIESVWHYSVIGVQSGWFPGYRVLIACPFDRFAAAAAISIRSTQDP